MVGPASCKQSRSVLTILCCTVLQDSGNFAHKVKGRTPVTILYKCGCSRGVGSGEAVVGKSTLTSCG